MTSDGRFFSAVGDHRGVDGNSYFYEYDPTVGELRLIGDVLSLLDHRRGVWGYGKVHAQMVLGPCEQVYASTYWGTRRGLEYRDGYTGDILVRLDPAERTTTVLGVPIAGHGTPSMSGAGGLGLLYGEAVDPSSDPDAGVMYAYDLSTGETIVIDDSADHVGFRSAAVDAEGRVLFTAPAGRVTRYDPATGSSTVLDDPLPGRFIRAATGPAPDGTIYAVTQDPAEFVALRSDGTVHELGPAPGYVTSLAMEPDGSAIYFVPGAHGDAWRDGTPLSMLDPATGRIDVVLELNPLTEASLELTAGGTYNVVLDPARRRLFVGLNAAPVATREESTFGDVVLLDVSLPAPDSVASTSDGDPAGAADVDALTCWTAPAESAGAESPGPVWEDTTAGSGIDDALIGMMGHAAAWGDLDGDRRVDLVVGTFADRPVADYRVRGAVGPSPDRLLLATERGGWDSRDVDLRAGRTSGAIAADLDLDDDLDIVLARNVTDGAPTPTQVWRNDGGRFEPVDSGLDPRSPGRSVGILDLDRDGLHDLVVVEDRFRGGSSRLYRNLGDLRFAPFESSGWPDDVWGLGVGTGDLDGDGVTDIVVGGSNRVFRGTGSGLIEQVGVIPAWETFGNEDDPAGVALGDVDADGDLDVVIGQHFNSTIDDGQRVPVRLYENRSRPGRVALADVTGEAGLVGLGSKAPHVALVDLDNDSRLDVLTSAGANGGSEPAVFMNHTDESGIHFGAPSDDPGDGQYWVTAPTADVDRDGRVDVVLVEWDPALPSRLLLNRSPSGHFLDVAVDASLGGGPGTKVDAYEAGRVGQPDALISHVEISHGQGYGAGIEAIAHLGLGERTTVDVVVAPPDGERIVLTGVPTDRRLRLPGGC